MLIIRIILGLAIFIWLASLAEYKTNQNAPVNKKLWISAIVIVLITYLIFGG